MAKYTPEFLAKLTFAAMLCECGIDPVEAKAIAEEASHAAAEEASHAATRSK
jgi:hypothetical protein